MIERRSYLRENDALQNTVVLLDAAANGDVLTQRAIVEGAAFAEQFRVQPDAILKSQEVAAEREKPEVSISLRALRSAYEMLKLLIGDAAREIGNLPDPLMIAAGIPSATVRSRAQARNDAGGVRPRMPRDQAGRARQSFRVEAY